MTPEQEEIFNMNPSDFIVRLWKDMLSGKDISQELSLYIMDNYCCVLDDLRWSEKRMDVVDRLLSLQGEQLEVWKTDNTTLCVSYAHCDVKDGYLLISEFGSGTTFYDACEDYYKKICGKTLVFNACTKHRKEVKVL